MDKSKIVPEIHRYMVCDLQAPMMLMRERERQRYILGPERLTENRG